MRSMSQPLSVCDAAVSATFRPLRKIVTTSETRRMSSRKCEMKTMLRPSSRSRCSIANRRSTSGGDSAEVGSSRMMMRAPENSTRASSISCCRPIGRSPMPRHRIDVDAETVARCSPASRAMRRQSTMPSRLVGCVAEKDVLGHRQVGRDAEFLMHHADAGRMRVARRAEAGSLPSSAKRPSKSRVHAGDDLHQRRSCRRRSRRRDRGSRRRASAKSTSRSASTPPKDFEMPCSSRMGGLSAPDMLAQIRK